MGNYLKYWRNIKGLTQTELAKKAGIDRSYLSTAEKGVKNLSLEYLKIIADVLEVTIGQLLEGPKRIIDPTDSIPVLAKIPAGPWREWIDDFVVGEGIDRAPRYDLKGNHIFAVIVDGDSMEPDLSDKDLLVLNPELAFYATHHGRIGVVKYNDSFKIRRVFLTNDNNNYILEPSNKSYKSEVLPVTGTTIFKIVDVRKHLGDKF